MKNTGARLLGVASGAVLVCTAAAVAFSVGQHEGAAAEKSTVVTKPMPSTSNVRTHARWETSRAWIPRSLGELNRASTTAVLATVSPDAAQEVVNGVPFTIRSVKVDKALRGSAATTLRVRELGDGLEPTSLQPGTKHVLFLSPFEMTRGQATDQYVVTAQYSGDYRIDSTSRTPGEATATRVDPDAPGLPAQASVTALTAAAEGATS